VGLVPYVPNYGVLVPSRGSMQTLDSHGGRVAGVDGGCETC
jgi:hypothetical protein